MDTNGFGRADKFKGAFRAFTDGVDDGAFDCLRWAAAQAETIAWALLDLDDRRPMSKRLSGQVYTA